LRLQLEQEHNKLTLELREKVSAVAWHVSDTSTAGIGGGFEKNAQRERRCGCGVVHLASRIRKTTGAVTTEPK
jgi:hypothetical protein